VLITQSLNLQPHEGGARLNNNETRDAVKVEIKPDVRQQQPLDYAAWFTVAYLLPLSAAGVTALAMPGVRLKSRGLWELVSISSLQVQGEQHRTIFASTCTPVVYC
jgi:hypothetical protein